MTALLRHHIKTLRLRMDAPFPGHVAKTKKYIHIARDVYRPKTFLRLV